MSIRNAKPTKGKIDEYSNGRYFFQAGRIVWGNLSVRHC
jgi:hypothetical protein